jgi:hypothetical protein
MRFHNDTAIANLFFHLNECKTDYILIRNIDQELPSRLEIGKDIDILARYDHREAIKSTLGELGYHTTPHPHRRDTYLYNTRRFDFFKSKQGIIVDVHYNLACRSLDAGQWIPLDAFIQESAWNNRRFISDDNLSYWRLGYEDELVALIVRSVFDKQVFQDGYIRQIEKMIQQADRNELYMRLKLVFFAYTDSLLNQIEARSYSSIRANYLQFADY